MSANKPDIKKMLSDPTKAIVVKTVGPLLPVPKSPDDLLGDIFRDIQKQRIFTDGKTFVDLVPKRLGLFIRQAYDIEKTSPNFNLNEFISRHFYEPAETAPRPNLTQTDNPSEHIESLWDVLTVANRKNRGSLLALPHPYVVPGGRFKEQFYWDTYFIMLGLARDGKWKMIDGMMRNYAYMIRKFGCIPTANRSYFLSRSQPPFLSHMVELLAERRGPLTRLEYLPYLVAEQKFWMRGYRDIVDSTNTALQRVVCMPDGVFLNRYYDDKATPRPESYDEDTKTAAEQADERAAKLFLDLRAGAESGWDFSSRWLDEPDNLRSIRTTEFVPVDLNCLLHHLETTIANGYSQMKQYKLAARFHLIAERRAAAITRWCWNETLQFFCDYDMRSGAPSERLTLAAVFPLFVGIASKEQAAAVAARLERDFLQPGGLVTTLIQNGQQWDAPNGWAPLQYITITGLKKYGFEELANTIRTRWLNTNQAVFASRHKFIEKYNVLSPGELGGGGEYPLQDGFGWTNGVYAALSNES
jgi:alpha,alpha-trehalase